MNKFNRYKVNCSEISDLMSREQGNNPPTEAEYNEFFKILAKDLIYVTDIQKKKVQDIIRKAVEYEKYPLSNTAKKNVYKHYAYAQFGVSKVQNGSKIPLQLEKGEVCEPSAIKLLSKIDGTEYVKNQKLVKNKFFKGIPDIILYEGDKIIGVKDIKIPVDLISFLERIDGDYLSEDRWEMLGYLDILGIKEGEICYCLVDMPKEVINQQLKEAKERYILNGYTAQHIKKLIKNLEKSMVYDYIPEEKRVHRFTVSRQNYFTSQMHKRVKMVREKMWLLHEKFEKGLYLPEKEIQLLLENSSLT